LEDTDRDAAPKNHWLLKPVQASAQQTYECIPRAITPVQMPRQAGQVKNAPGSAQKSPGPQHNLQACQYPARALRTDKSEVSGLQLSASGSIEASQNRYFLESSSGFQL